ncbi:MAG: uL15m family ribosomal protein, partial [Ilumatobacteraceae bacterium]
IETLVESGLLRKGDYAKVLAYGELTTKINVTAHAVSKSAEAAITALGGTVTIVPMPFKVRPAANGNQFTNR